MKTKLPTLAIHFGILIIGRKLGGVDTVRREKI